MVRLLLVVIVDGRRLVADWATRKAVGFAHGLRDFGGTDEVCSGEVPSGWFLPSIHREGLATVLAAVEDGDTDGRGDLS
jgi:hypothetical protein